MSARHKVNAAAVARTLLFSEVVGGVSESAAVFWIALGLLLLFNLVAGNIPLRRR